MLMLLKAGSYTAKPCSLPALQLPFTGAIKHVCHIADLTTDQQEFNGYLEACSTAVDGAVWKLLYPVSGAMAMLNPNAALKDDFMKQSQIPAQTEAQSSTVDSDRFSQLRRRRTSNTGYAIA